MKRFVNEFVVGHFAFTQLPFRNFYEFNNFTIIFLELETQTKQAAIALQGIHLDLAAGKNFSIAYINFTRQIISVT